MPGGNFGAEAYAEEVKALRSRYPFLDRRHAERLVRCYGTDAVAIIGAAADTTALGRHFGGTLYEAEVRWLMAREWALTAEDILWRRTKQGLFLTPEEVLGLTDYIDDIAGGRLKAI